MSGINDPTYPKTRDARRRQFQRIRDAHIAATPLDTVANVRSTLASFLPVTRRPSDPSPMGVWLPCFRIQALAHALEAAERELAREKRQPAQRVAS